MTNGNIKTWQTSQINRQSDKHQNEKWDHQA